MQKYRSYIFIAIGTAVLIFAIRQFEVAYLTGRMSDKLYITFVGLMFLGIGGYLGWRLRRKKVVVRTVEIERQIAPTLKQTELLTERETDILSSIVAGLSNKEIAERHFVSENTVKKHINNIYSKLGVRRRAQVIARAKEAGIIA
jgi:two-component system, NarL family, response regulator LiaR